MGLSVYGKRLNFVYDAAVIANSVNNLLEDLMEQVNKIGLTINVSKCKSKFEENNAG